MLHVAFLRSRRVGPLLTCLAAALVADGALPRVAHAQPSAPLTYLYLRGSTDTLGVEVITRSPTAVGGVLTMRGQPRLEWEHKIVDGRPTTLQLKVFAPGAAESATPVQTGAFTVQGDSVSVNVAAGAQTINQRAATRAGAQPLVNASVLHAAFMASYALRMKQDSVPLFLTSGAQTVVGAVLLRGDTVLLQMAGSQMHIVNAPDGLPREVTMGAQPIRVVRARGPVAAPPSRPERIDYSAPASAPYSAESVSIPTPRGYALAGTLTKPKGMAKVPVVITISGSGPQERDSRLPPLPGYAIFREIADTLGRRGIAVLRYDDRGVGESGGATSRAKATSADFADDVRTIVAWLRTRPDIDGSRIALVGHSEGGMIAPMVAATDSTLRGIALLAGTAFSGRRILMFQNRLGVDAAPGLTTVQRDSIYATVPAKLDSIGAADAWYGYFMAHDPLITARTVKPPVLILQGLTDTQVTPDQADTLALALKAGGSRAVTVRTFPATNHLFLEDPTGLAQGYAQLKNIRVRRDVLGALAEWMVRTLR